MSSLNNNQYKPTITKGEQYVVSTSSDGKKSYGAVLSGKALYSTNLSISNKLAVGCWITTTNSFKPTFKWLADTDKQINVLENGEWSFSTGALQKGQYEFLLKRYYLSEDGKDNWLESDQFHIDIDHPTKFGLLATILTSCLVFITFIFLIYSHSHRFIHNKRTKIIWIALLLGLNIACFIFMSICYIFFSGLFIIWEFFIMVPLFLNIITLVIYFQFCRKEILEERQERQERQEREKKERLGSGSQYINLFDSLKFHNNNPQLFLENKHHILPKVLNLLKDRSPQGKEARIVMHDLLKHFFTNFRPFVPPLPMKYLALQHQLKNPASRTSYKEEGRLIINSLLNQLHKDDSQQGLIAKQILAQDIEEYIKNNPKKIDSDTRLLWAMSSIRQPHQLFSVKDIQQMQRQLTQSKQLLLERFKGMKGNQQRLATLDGKLNYLKRMKARLTGVESKPPNVSSITPSPQGYQLVRMDDEPE